MKRWWIFRDSFGLVMRRQKTRPRGYVAGPFKNRSTGEMVFNDLVFRRSVP